MRPLTAVLCLSVAAAAPAPARANSLMEIRAAQAACRDFALAQPTLSARGVTADDLRAAFSAGETDNRALVTLRVDRDDLEVRGFCIAVGRGANWSPIEVTFTRIVER